MEQKFIDAVEGQFTAEEQREFDLALELDPSLRQSFEEYKAVMQCEQMMRDEVIAPSPSFVTSTMEAIPAQPRRSTMRSWWRVAELFTAPHLVLSGAATAAVFVVALKLTEEGMSGYQQGAPTSIVSGVTSTDGRVESRSSANTAAPSNDLSTDVSAPPARAVPLDGVSGVVPEPQPPVAVVADSRLSGRMEGAAGRFETGAMRADSLAGEATAQQQVARRHAAEMQGQQGASVGGTIALSPSAAMQEKGYGADEQIPVVGPAPYSPPQGRIARVLPPPHTAERYNHWGENARQQTSAEPFSTFGLEVDTGSYTNARRFLRMGSLPPPEAVRVEEFINYFSYDYPSRGDAPFNVSYEIAPSPFDPQRYLVKLGVAARPAREERLPWNLVFLIDTSGSMSDDNKLPLVQSALRYLVDQMRDHDRISIVTYAGSTSVPLEPTSGKERDRILAAIDSLSAGGSTYGSGGIQRAYDLAARSRIPEGVNRIVLATDGDFNVGVTSQAQLIQFIEQKRQSGITLTTVGVGTGNLNEAMMEQIANKGDGNYFYLDSFEEARKVFGKDLAANMEVVGKDVKVQVEFNPKAVKEHRLIGYENRALAHHDFSNDAVDSGEVGSGHTVTAFYEVLLVGRGEGLESRYQPKPTVAEPPPEEIGFVKVRYKAPEGGASKEESFALRSAEVLPSAERASTDFRFASAVAHFAQLLRRSQYASGYTVADVEQVAARAVAEQPSATERREFLEMVRNARVLLERSSEPSTPPRRYHSQEN